MKTGPMHLQTDTVCVDMVCMGMVVSFSPQVDIIVQMWL